MHMEKEIKYWCFSCQKHFSVQKQAGSCAVCHSEAIEIANQADSAQDPSTFQVYQVENQRPSPPSTQQPVQPQPQLHMMYNIFANRSPLPLNVNVMAPIPINNATTQQNFLQMSFNLNNIANIFNNFQQSFHQSQGIFNLLNSIMGQRNLSPASPAEVDKLEKIDKVKDCSICQQEEEEGIEQQRKGYKLACGHNFHIDCLGPWIQRTNTCPTCRARL